MIIFELACRCGFEFEGWFRDHEDYAAQHRSGLLTCPECGGAGIRKILSPVALHTGSGDGGPGEKSPRREVAEAAIALLRSVGSFVEKNFEDVGHGLAQEALKMLYGTAESRNIRGEATPDEEKILNREGIRLLKVPVLPEDEPSN